MNDYTNAFAKTHSLEDSRVHVKTIVVLDAYTLSPLQPGEKSPMHPDWDDLAKCGHLMIYPRTAPGEIIDRCQNAEIVLTNKTPLDAKTITALPRLKYIGVMATGYNIVDLQMAQTRGIIVTNIPEYASTAVAQHVFALLFELTTHVAEHDKAVKRGEWMRCPDFSFTVSPLHELSGKTLGLVGFGAIAQTVARIGAAFGMEIAVHSRSQKSFDFPISWKSLPELLTKSDVVSLHCPLTSETKHLINHDTIELMKPTAYLINTARGPLVDEVAVSTALQNGKIAGFGTDVLGIEPPTADNPLLRTPNTIITPHIGWASVEARHRLMQILVKNVQAYLAGSPINAVN